VKFFGIESQILLTL